jgi:hypothetical protein
MGNAVAARRLFLLTQGDVDRIFRRSSWSTSVDRKASRQQEERRESVNGQRE